MTYQSAKPDAGTTYYRAGSPEDVADTIAAQDRARAGQPVATQAKSWAPWIVGGLALAGVVWLINRD